MVKKRKRPMDSSTNIDPVLEYLLEFNKDTPIEYSDRYLIPVGGLAKMLGDFKGFHLNRVEVIKSELSLAPEPSTSNDIDKLLGMI